MTPLFRPNRMRHRGVIIKGSTETISTYSNLAHSLLPSSSPAEPKSSMTIATLILFRLKYSTDIGRNCVGEVSGLL